MKKNDEVLICKHCQEPIGKQDRVTIYADGKTREYAHFACHQAKEAARGKGQEEGEPAVDLQPAE